MKSKYISRNRKARVQHGFGSFFVSEIPDEERGSISGFTISRETNGDRSGFKRSNIPYLQTKGGLMSRKSRKFHFTNKRIEALPPNPRESKSIDQDYSDTTPGLKLFVSKTGRKSFHSGGYHLDMHWDCVLSQGALLKDGILAIDYNFLLRS